MKKNLMKEIYNAHLEYKEASESYRKFLDGYVGLMVQEKPQNEQENYHRYWNGLKKHSDNIFCFDKEIK